jgi:Rieske 2Fe-2S family protein
VALDPDFDAQDVFEFTMLISRQDWAICEAVQKGVGSRSFRQGVLVPLEEYVAEFDRWLLEQLGPAAHAMPRTGD